MKISTDVLNTLRRRTTDKMCKDKDFLKEVLGVAIESGAIKTNDILSIADIKAILQ